MACRVTRYEDVVQDEVTPLQPSFLVAEFQGQREVKGQGLLQGSVEAVMGKILTLGHSQGRGVVFAERSEGWR